MAQRERTRRSSTVSSSYFGSRSDVSEVSEDETGQCDRRLVFTIIKLFIYCAIWLGCVVLIFFIPAPHVTAKVVAVEGKSMRRVYVDIPRYSKVNVQVEGNVDDDVTNHPNLDDGKRKYISLYIEEINSRLNRTSMVTKMWRAYLKNDTSSLRRREYVKRQFDVKEIAENKAFNDEDRKLQLVLANRNRETYVFKLRINTDAMDKSVGVISAGVLLILLCFLSWMDMADAPFACVLITTTSLGVLGVVDELPAIKRVISWVDTSTLLLTFSLMVIVSIMSETGIFGYLALVSYRIAQGRRWVLLTLLLVMSAVLTTFVDLITLMMIIVPILIHLCESLHMHTMTVVFYVIIFSNITCCLTPTGDLPNTIIGTSPYVRREGLDFVTFVAHMFPGVFLSCIVAWLYMYFVLRSEIPRGRDADIRRSLLILKKRSERKSSVLNEISERVRELESIDARQREKGALRHVRPADFIEQLATMQVHYQISDKPLLIKCCMAIFLALLFFALEGFAVFEGISLAWAAFLATMFLLILFEGNDICAILNRVEWSTILLFASMFVFSEVCIRLGLIEFMAEFTMTIIASVSPRYQIITALLLVLWMTDLFLFCLDSATLISLLLNVTIYISLSDKVQIPLSPMIWALAYGIGFGGNGSFITTTSNTVACAIANNYGYNLSSWQFFKHGFPIMLITNTIASVYLIIAHGILKWH